MITVYFHFWFKNDFGQKYYAPQVRPDQGSNSWPPDHDSTVHVTKTSALTTRPSVISFSHSLFACDLLNYVVAGHKWDNMWGYPVLRLSQTMIPKLTVLNTTKEFALRSYLDIQRIQKLIGLHLFTGLFQEDLSSLGRITVTLYQKTYLHLLSSAAKPGAHVLENNKITGVFTMLKLCMSKERNM